MGFLEDLETAGLTLADFKDVSWNYDFLFKTNGILGDRLYVKVPEIKYIESFNEYIIKEFLKARNYYNIDYIEGTCFKGKRKFKIGKILNKLGEKIYLNIFESDITRLNIKKSYTHIVISRKPEDILYMSTGRRWSSCASLEYKKTQEGLKKNNQLIDYINIRGGGVVVYGIHWNDKDIKEPYFRKWFPNEAEDQNFSNYYGLCHFSTMKFIDNYMNDYLDTQRSDYNSKLLDCCFYTGVEKIKDLLYGTFEGRTTGVRAFLYIECSILTDILLCEEEDIIDQDVIFYNSINILNDLDIFIKEKSFRRRLVLMRKLIIKYINMNIESEVLSKQAITELIKHKLIYHYLGNSVIS